MVYGDFIPEAHSDDVLIIRRCLPDNSKCFLVLINKGDEEVLLNIALPPYIKCVEDVNGNTKIPVNKNTAEIRVFAKAWVQLECT